MGISQQQALDCFASDDLIGIGMEADALRRTLHPGSVVSYSVERTIDIGRKTQEILNEIRHAVSSGATSVCITRAAATEPAQALSMTQVEETLRAIRSDFPSLLLQALSAGEILTLAEEAGLSVREALLRLRAAGLDSFAGDDLHIDCQPASQDRETAAFDQLLALHRTAHQIGIRSTAGLTFGAGESLEQRVRHLFAIRDLQQETGGFTAFTPLSFQPGNTPNAAEEPTAVEYLRTLAVSRMVLDNIENIESNCEAQGLKVVQMGLRFGANDTGSIRVRPKASFTEEDLRRVIRDAGFKPVERDTLYQTMFLNN